MRDYPETRFGGEFETAADYRDPFVADLIEAEGWMLWPPIRFSFDTVNYDLTSPAPSPPSRCGDHPAPKSRTGHPVERQSACPSLPNPCSVSIEEHNGVKIGAMIRTMGKFRDTGVATADRWTTEPR